MERTPGGEGPHVCARCAARGTACCTSAEGLAGPPLTPGDVERIAARSGLAPAQFVVEREVDAVEEQAWSEEDPALAGIVRAGRVRSLGRRGADCLFLGRGGCTLGDGRPLACHRFPLVRVGRRLTPKPGGQCLAVEEAGGLDELLVLLGTSRRRLAAVERQLRRELAD
jgi:Fe-S-cluster containining protein